MKDLRNWKQHPSEECPEDLQTQSGWKFSAADGTRRMDAELE